MWHVSQPLLLRAVFWDILSLTPEAQIPKVVEDAADIELIRDF